MEFTGRFEVSPEEDTANILNGTRGRAGRKSICERFGTFPEAELQDHRPILKRNRVRYLRPAAGCAAATPLDLGRSLDMIKKQKGGAMDIADFGFDQWFAENMAALSSSEGRAARIVAVDRDQYLVCNGQKSVPAALTGRLMFSTETNEDLPCVGDWVLVDYYDDETHAIIYALFPRKSVLKRKTAGRQIDYQLIAANIDVAFIVQSCDVDYNLNRLDRYIVMIKDGGIEPVLVLTKSDLVDSLRLESITAEVEQQHRIRIVAVSNITGAGYEGLDSILEKGKTYCLIGSSGVGKSTLLNNLLQRNEFATNEVSGKSGKGKHTTTRRQLVMLDSGVMFVDTPGMRELGLISFDQGLAESFEDIAGIARGCRFKDCSHTLEEGCAVLQEVHEGRLSANRYQSYLKLLKESEYYGMSYYDKRKKDKAFGKFLKNYMKHDKKR
jgi:ribosome biogenesis GTPase